MGNTRMKDFHDLYSLIALEGCLNPSYTDQVVAMVFTHRQTSTENLPLKFDSDFIDILQPLWRDYRKTFLQVKRRFHYQNQSKE